MKYREVLKAFSKITEEEKGYDKLIWVGLDGIFHDTDYPDDEGELGELICYCGVSHSMDRDDWIVTPWLYTTDCAAVFKKASSAQQMAYFWLNWMEHIYGDRPIFEADWLAVKSNRSLLMMLFDRDGETLKRELWKEEGITGIGPYIPGSGISIITHDI